MAANNPATANIPSTIPPDSIVPPSFAKRKPQTNIVINPITPPVRVNIVIEVKLMGFLAINRQTVASKAHIPIMRIRAIKLNKGPIPFPLNWLS